ncbi:TRAP transporter large permease subunit [Ramlibacter sp. G-1-2-2]|uniref:TRAP transporter large permease subunit n=1 Tax=Ramlibacter agri TaxID=2728837 RepID=A0A848GZC2_9BURK|nr:TRAP transporter large permease subunit [Ramlibacter agri]NML42649.1 TRAP transporter large permease subunit [Ramlibacter agri]
MNHSVAASENEPTGPGSVAHDDLPHQPFSPAIEHAFDVLLALVLFLELVLLFGNTAMRGMFNTSLVWANEVAEYSLTSLAFIGGAVAYHRGLHLVVRIGIDQLPRRWQEYAECARHYFVIAVAIIGLCYAWPMWHDSWTVLTVVLQIPKSWTLLPFFIGMGLTVIFALAELRRHTLKENIVAGAAVAVLVIAWYLAWYFTGSWSGGPLIAFALVLLLFLVFAGVPIAYVLSVTAYIAIYSSGEDMMAVSLAMSNGISSFILLAVPFFILAGNVMTDGGLTKPLADWVTAMVGRMRGGLLQALVVAMYIFSGISGSKIADVAAVGTTLKGMLKEQGYDPAESAAVLAAAGIMGETIPPSLVMMVLASITTLSVATFFVAGVVPAAVLGVCLMIIIHRRAKKHDWPRCAPISWPERLRLSGRALPALAVPIILIIGIVGGIATTTEVSSIAVVFSIVVSVFIYRGMNLRSFIRTLASSGAMAGMVLFMVSAGSAFSWTLAISGLQSVVTDFLALLGGSAFAFMVFSVVLMVIMGSILEGLPSLLIFGPMLLQLTKNYGIDPMAYGIVIIISMGIGTFIPPFGVCYFVTCSVMDTTVERVTPRFLPYLLMLLVGLVFIAIFPAISLALPHAFNLH